MSNSPDPVSYEAFGAVGDGVADDLLAICQAHAHANAHGLGVRSKPDATYHLGGRALTVVIATDTDWSTSRFTIDDSQEVEDHKKPLFTVRSLLEPVTLQIDRLVRDQRSLDLRLDRDCHVLVEDDRKRVYIRRGLNQNAGVPQHDCFVLRRDGSIEGDIDGEYASITRIEAKPIDQRQLVVRGGVFTTIANRMRQEIGYNYWARNIVISRSNTLVDGLTHYVVGETDVGHPYTGFISVVSCSDITLRDCFATGHKIYTTIGTAGAPVSMGSYDLHANNVVNFRMIGCRMNHIRDRTRWGVIGSNFCKNILLEDCVLSRMDTHMGVSGSYVIRRCTLGWMGLNAIGRGLLLIEDTTSFGESIVSFRSDYGSTWEGEVAIRNCRWIPASGDVRQPALIHVHNDGMHDFGYPCSMPREVTIDGLHVDDSNHPGDYRGNFLFSDPDHDKDAGATTAMADRPFPYQPCHSVKMRGLTTVSGLKPIVSSNTAFRDSVIVVEV